MTAPIGLTSGLNHQQAIKVAKHMERPQSVFALQKLLRSLDEAADDAAGEDPREGSLARLLDSVAGRLGRRKRSDAGLPQDS